MHAERGESSIDLVRAARQGDLGSLGILLKIHYGGMYAVAYGILGNSADAEDVCQDAAITAMSRLGDLRDPTAVSAWLKAIVRNNCRMRLRTRPPLPVGLPDGSAGTSFIDDPALIVERHATRDWIWDGLMRLTPTVREAAILRYFTQITSYQEIAQVCGVPVGTVRSRLSEARRRLAGALPGTVAERHDDITALTAERREEAIAVLSSVPSATPEASLSGRWSPEVEITWPTGDRLIGFSSLFAVFASDYADGVRYRLTNVVAGPGLTIWENQFVNPPEDPDHCPPAITWLLKEAEGRIQSVRLFYAPRPAPACDPEHPR
ncbi:RNA polymerase sigma factor [Actinoallomurus acaciae]|uniref:RNA polymerase sigma factor n=1 Tax=Actinoallomurus acaciae TaxID=502577 RepID=A0ABV5Y8C4_9ACTN